MKEKCCYNCKYGTRWIKFIEKPEKTYGYCPVISEFVLNNEICECYQEKGNDD